tara:strand:- start:8052 stop:9536 length:1485 start_codon:yes stop_codon:yes gene_type:complete
VIKGIKYILLGIASFAAATSHADGAMLMGYWDSYVNNDTNYVLKNLRNVKDEAGKVTEIYKKELPSNFSDKIYSVTTNYYGNLSQEMQFDIYEQNGNSPIGSCILHSGIGSYFASPNFNGSKCTLHANINQEDNTSENLIVSPSYIMEDSNYKVTYKISKDKHLSRIIVFGDSLSDMGNLYRSHNGALPKSPPYFNGHFSDGEIWVEHFSKHFNIPRFLISNYAYGGASINQTWRPVYGLEKQIGQYLTWNPTADSSALYVVWIGSNDFVYGVSGSVDEAVANASNTVEAQLKLLIKNGAKNFLLPNLPNFAISPIAHEVDVHNNNEDYSHMLTTLASTYNKSLVKLISKLEEEYPDVTFVSYDIYSLLDYAIINYKSLGFKNNIGRCNPNEVNDFSRKVCSNPYEYVFWDGLHPTSHTHAVLAKEIYKVMLRKGFKPNTKMQRASLVANVDEISYRNMQAIEDFNKKLMIADSEPLGLGFLNPEYIIVNSVRK